MASSMIVSCTIATALLLLQLTTVCTEHQQPQEAACGANQEATCANTAAYTGDDDTSMLAQRMTRRTSSSAEAPSGPLVNSTEFYGYYFGHPTGDLEEVHKTLPGPYAWLLGDSTLDNKYWIKDEEGEKEGSKPVNGYDKVFGDGGFMQRDVSYWLNKLAEEQDLRLTTINTAVEESTIGSRNGEGEHFVYRNDRFVYDNIGPEDVLIVSIIGNDIALKPTMETTIAMLSMTYSASEASIRDGTARGFATIQRLVRDKLQSHIERVVGKQLPKKVLACMVYYPGEKQGATVAWADMALAALGYDVDPKRLQLIIRSQFVHGTMEIDIPGTEVVPVPLFVALNGSDPADYQSRVEPSVQGGKKMAQLLLRVLGGEKPEIPELERASEPLGLTGLASSVMSVLMSKMQLL